MASETRRGVSGVSSKLAPSERNASATDRFRVASRKASAPRSTRRSRSPDPHHVRPLRGQVDDHLLLPAVPVRDHAATFERNRGLPVHAELAAQLDRRASERSEIALVDGRGDVSVVGPVLEQPGAVRAHGSDAIDDGRQLIDLDLDSVGNVLVGREPIELRRQNIVSAHQMPYTTIGGMKLDTGDYQASLATALAQSLGLPEHKVRVIAPDVGGGFGGKNRLMPEEVAVAAIAMKVGHPVRWIEDRREHLMASVHAREHVYDVTVFADADGRLLGLEGDVYIDAGAYALWPTGAFMEASMAARNLPGPYQMRALKVNTFTVATNKAPMGPYRGVARPGACFAIERMVGEIARPRLPRASGRGRRRWSGRRSAHVRTPAAGKRSIEIGSARGRRRAR
jgi:molybdopterin-binding aldehyde dehydrogenase-like protein